MKEKKPFKLKVGQRVIKLWEELRMEDGSYGKTEEAISVAPHLSFNGEWMVQFEGSCCAYLARLCIHLPILTYL